MNRRFLIFFIPIILYIILKYQNLNIVPDIFGLQSIKASEYFELVLNITAPILGIMVAVVLLMFQIRKDTFLRRKGESFTDKPMIFLIVVISLSILILGFVSYITLPNFETGPDLTVDITLASFLFVLYYQSFQQLEIYR